MSKLDELKRLPPPGDHGRRYDWGPAAAPRGVRDFPSDFKALAEAYGDVSFANYAIPLYPDATGRLDIAKLTFEKREALSMDEIGEPPSAVPPGVVVQPRV